MSRSRRPTAFELSFPEESDNAPAQQAHRPASSHSQFDRRGAHSGAIPARYASSNSSKRKDRDDRIVDLTGQSKRRRKDEHGRNLCYRPDPKDRREEKDMFILGEDPEDDAPDGDDVPMRVLLDFCIFDHKSCEVLSLDVLDNDHDRYNLEAAGFVAPVFLDEEDAGQEDDGQDEERDQHAYKQQRLRTTSIFRYTIDYTKMDDPVYIQTQFSWYRLKTPSTLYKRHFQDFYRPHRISQIVISAANQNARWSWRDFCQSYIGMWDPLTDTRIQQVDIDATIPFIRLILEELTEGPRLSAIPMLRELLSRQHTSNRGNSAPLFRRVATARGPSHSTRRSTTGNIDLVVLRPEQQEQTRVTPLIDKLALGLFQEHLAVVGANIPDKRDLRRVAKVGHSWTLKLLDKWLEYENKSPQVEFPRNARISRDYWRAVVVDGREYSVGDVVIVPAGPDEERRKRRPDLPTDIDDMASYADYFWFGKILHIHKGREKIHCQWLEHASMTILGEIGDPQELFLCPTCDDQVEPRSILDKVTVHWNMKRDAALEPSEYYCRFLYHEVDATFTALDEDYFYAAQMSMPGENCPVCLIHRQRDEEAEPTKITNGISYYGANYHIDDFALLENSANDGPAQIVQILDFTRTTYGMTLRARCLGRISDITNICPQDVIKDERHLFLTDAELNVDVERLVQRCTVLHPGSAPVELTEWLSFSPYHFYVRFHFRTMQPVRWSDKTIIKNTDVFVCSSCLKEDTDKVLTLKNIRDSKNPRPLRGFDPFAGVGAFGLGMERAGCLEMVQAVEISPSAARTLQENSPHTIVHNQCSNIVLEYAIKSQAGHKPKVPRAIGNRQPLPAPPKPGDIDCIVAGFPCQPHSRLNMFQRADDRKSHLILTLLSWIDFLRPKYCFMENVRGFLSYRLNATQAGRYSIEGGIVMGGLKFLIHALLSMDYQVRFCLLQAAHYGTPQSRVRFFLIASRRGYPLPAVPQPTHEFPIQDALQFKLTNGGRSRPVMTRKGIAPLRYVSIDDAIADLPRFHWKNPHKLRKHGSRARRQGSGGENEEEDGDGIPELTCDPAKAYCGLSGPHVRYHSEPITSFQVKCRSKPSRDLQHYTRVLKEATVERVVNIPMKAKSTFKDLGVEMWEWQFANASSAVARDGFRAGMYGRLDRNQWFHTTVTNVEPTAKQSWVLSPFCKRIVTVRELARSQGFPDAFVFYSSNNDVKTMHRQIGNAVPWPIAEALGRELLEAFLKKWQGDREQAIVVE